MYGMGLQTHGFTWQLAVPVKAKIALQLQKYLQSLAGYCILFLGKLHKNFLQLIVDLNCPQTRNKTWPFPFLCIWLLISQTLQIKKKKSFFSPSMLSLSFLAVVWIFVVISCVRDICECVSAQWAVYTLSH